MDGIRPVDEMLLDSASSKKYGVLIRISIIALRARELRAFLAEPGGKQAQELEI